MFSWLIWFSSLTIDLAIGWVKFFSQEYKIFSINSLLFELIDSTLKLPLVNVPVLSNANKLHLAKLSICDDPLIKIECLAALPIPIK